MTGEKCRVLILPTDPLFADLEGEHDCSILEKLPIFHDGPHGGEIVYDGRPVAKFYYLDDDP